MGDPREALPTCLAERSRIGPEISITGKWVPTRPAHPWRGNPASAGLRTQWEEIHEATRHEPGVLSTEVNHAVGEDAVLVHQVFRDAEAVVHHFATTQARHRAALAAVGTPELHLVRGMAVSATVTRALEAANLPFAVGDLIFGFVRDYRQPEGESAVQVTAKWTGKPGVADTLDQLEHWWQRVGTDAHSLEQGLLRFEVYRVFDEDALIVHETFATSSELTFHLTKGTAATYKQEIDLVAATECCYSRGPVAWRIRTHSRFTRLPATYSSRDSRFAVRGGSMSDGTIA